MPDHEITTREQWLAARKELLERAPKGGDDSVKDRRHDEYEDARA